MKRLTLFSHETFALMTPFYIGFCGGRVHHATNVLTSFLKKWQTPILSFGNRRIDDR